MREVLCSILCTAVLFSAGCRRPDKSAEPKEWERSPGLDPHPAGMTPEGTMPSALPRASFRLDPRRSLAEALGQQQNKGPGSPEEATYREAADRGEAWAQAKLGEVYVQQTKDAAKLWQGVQLLNAAAGQRDPDALRILGALAGEGRGVPQSDKEALRLTRQAADLGSPEAQFGLASMSANGRGVGRDPEAALFWAREAARQGFGPAQLVAGKELLSSVEEERRKEGLAILQKASQEGNAQAALFLSSAMANGQFGLTRDDLRMESVLLPSAEKGNAECQLSLAALYQTSEILSLRREEVTRWLVRAARGGSAKAVEILRQGGGFAEIGEEEARYLEAAARGESKAQRKLGQLYLAKADDPESVSRGVSLLRNASAQNDAEALYLLGGMAASGRGMTASVREAFNYCLRAAELGHAEAQYQLAAMYSAGQGVAADEQKAFEWARKAAEQGNSKAKFSVGRLMLVQAGAERQQEALRLLNDAANAGVVESAIFLAQAHAEGRHALPKNPDEAIRLLTPLAQQGNGEAADALRRIEQEQKE